MSAAPTELLSPRGTGESETSSTPLGYSSAADASWMRSAAKEAANGSTASTRSPESMKGPVWNISPARTSSCPTVGANCRGGRTADAMRWLKIRAGSRELVGSRGEVGMSGRGTRDIPRFGALRRDNTPSPAECGLCVNDTGLLLELFWGGRQARAQAVPPLCYCSCLSARSCSTDRMLSRPPLERSITPLHGGLLGGFIGQPPRVTTVKLHGRGAGMSASGSRCWGRVTGNAVPCLVARHGRDGSAGPQ